MPETKTADVICYLERSSVREILAGVADEHVHIAQVLLMDIDALPIVTASDIVKAAPMAERWRVVDRGTQFNIMCERARAHIQVVFGDHKYNQPIYGSRDEALADAALICAALNRRDAPPSAPRQEKP